MKTTLTHSKRRRLAIVAAIGFGIGLEFGVAGPAVADGARQYPLAATYKEECGSCHVAFPPGLLARDSWQALMAGLSRHFGSDASVDPARAQEIGSYLAANAGRSDKFAATGRDGRPNLYLSRTPWFLREHRDGHDGLAATVWKSAAVKSPANCGACHRGADGGDYSERNIRIPKIDTSGRPS